MPQIFNPEESSFACKRVMYFTNQSITTFSPINCNKHMLTHIFYSNNSSWEDEKRQRCRDAELQTTSDQTECGRTAGGSEDGEATSDWSEAGLRRRPVDDQTTRQIAMSRDDQ